MIPSIAEILSGLAAGTYTEQQAAAWIDQHIAAAVADAATRDDFAGTAMCLLLTRGISLPEVPRLSYELADNILAARNA
jgi:hypothetical protein